MKQIFIALAFTAAYTPVSIAGGANEILKFRLICSNDGAKYVCALQDFKKSNAILPNAAMAYLIFLVHPQNPLEVPFTLDELEGGHRFHFELPEGASGDLDLRHPTLNEKKPLMARAFIKGN